LPRRGTCTWAKRARAWNDWLYHEWYLAYPERIIPGGITYLSDPGEAVREIERNAARGFTSVTFPERPHAIGLPSLWDREHWDPIIAACVETGTVVSLHVGSSGTYPVPAGSPALELTATMFGQLSVGACSEWLWPGYPLRHPALRIAMSEGGIGWVPMLIDRLDNLVDRSGYGRGWAESPTAGGTYRRLSCASSAARTRPPFTGIRCPRSSARPTDDSSDPREHP
jgi:predicted TIM-barrel fold metal-dependent hydrolase